MLQLSGSSVFLSPEHVVTIEFGFFSPVSATDRFPICQFPPPPPLQFVLVSHYVPPESLKRGRLSYNMVARMLYYDAYVYRNSRSATGRALKNHVATVRSAPGSLPPFRSFKIITQPDVPRYVVVSL